jgi:hypothetical protein
MGCQGPWRAYPKRCVRVTPMIKTGSGIWCHGPRELDSIAVGLEESKDDCRGGVERACLPACQSVRQTKRLCHMFSGSMMKFDFEPKVRGIKMVWIRHWQKSTFRVSCHRGYLRAVVPIHRSEGRLERLEGILATAVEASLGSLPVENVPDVLHVGSLAVEVLWYGQ